MNINVVIDQSCIDPSKAEAILERIKHLLSQHMEGK